MKRLYKILTIFTFLLVQSGYVRAQCDFKAGDIAFTGYQIFDDNLNGTAKDDAFSFVLLKDAPGGLELFFTDLGWTNANKFQTVVSSPTDGVIKWKAPVEGMKAGTQVAIKAKFALTATVGTVVGIQSTAITSQYMSLGVAGDQLFAFTGTKDLPVFVAGISINKGPWDLDLPENRISSSSSRLPIKLQTGSQNLSFYALEGNAYNAILKDELFYAGKSAYIISKLNDVANWEVNSAAYNTVIPDKFNLPSKGMFQLSPPDITTQPGSITVCLADKAIFKVVASDDACSYFWEISSNGVAFTELTEDAIYSGVNTATLTINNVADLNGKFFRVRVIGAVPVNSANAKLTVIVDKPTLTIPTGTNAITYGGLTSFSVTGSEYVKNYHWQVSKDEGITFELIDVNDVNYQGVETPVLKLMKPTVAMSGYQYRAWATDGCLEVLSEATTLTVDKKELIIKAKNANKVYDGLVFTNWEIESYNGFVHEDTKSVLSGTLVNTGESHGAIQARTASYEIVLLGLTADNYSVVFEKGAFTVSPAVLKITAVNKTRVYGEDNPLLTVAYEGLVNGETSIADLSFTTTAAKGSSVGTYPIEVSGSSTNYTIEFVPGVLSITKKGVTVTAINRIKVYGDNHPAFTLSFAGLVNGDTEITGLSATTLATEGSSVGTYPITVSGTSNNYSMTFVPGILSVTKKSVTVTAENQTKAYGDSNPELSLAYVGLVNNEVGITGLSVTTTAVVGSSVGTYPIVATGTSPNYEIAFAPGILTVTKKAVTVTAANKTKVYGEDNPGLSLTYSGLANGEVDIAGLSVTTIASKGSSVGTFPITVSGTSPNYDITFVSGTLSVTKKTVTVTAANKTKVYGEDNPELTLAYSGLVNNETLITGLSITTTATKGSSVGTHPIVVDGTSANYSITFVPGTLSITKKSVTVTAVNQTKEYGLDNPVLTLDYAGLENNEVDITGLSVTTTATKGSSVGSYPIVATGTSINYNISFVPGVLSISKKAVTVTAINKTKDYGADNPVLTLDYVGLGNSETEIAGLSVTTTATKGSIVGTYPISVSGTSPNYDISFVQGVLSVIKKTITVTATNQTKVYGEDNPGLSLAYSGLVNNEVDIAGLSVTTIASKGSSVGTYPIVATGFSDNYSISFVPGTLSITQKTVTVTAANKTKVYGEDNPELTLSYTGLVNNETSIADLLVSTLAGKGSSVGTYPIVGTGSSVNYNITFIPGILSITKKAVTVKASNMTREYGVDNPELILVYTGLENNEVDIVGLSVSTTATKGSLVGAYPIVVSGTSVNYDISFLPGVLTITKKTVTITAANKTKVYGEDNPGLSLTYFGLANNEVDIAGLSVTTIATKGSSVGTYPIVGAGSSDNYNISFVPGTLSVTQKGVTVTAANKTKVYGEVNPELTLAYSGLVNNETSITGLSITTTATKGSFVGTYPITIAGTSDNYEITIVPGVLRVTKKAVTVTAVNKTKVYGDDNPELTLSYAGLVNNETNITSLITSTVATAGSTVGIYPIIVSGTSPNYDITFVNGKLTVTPRGITVTAVAKSKIFGEMDPELNYTVFPELVNDDKLTGKLSRVSGDNIGQYAIQQNSLAANSNYTLIFKSADFTIEKANISGVVFEGQNVTYNGAKHSLSVIGLTPEATVAYLNNEQTIAGTYIVKATISRPNYNDLVLNASLVINKAAGIITSNALQAHVYDGTVKNVLASLNHNEVVLSYGPLQGYTNAGTYDITISANETANYYAITQKVQLLINQADFTGLVFKDKTGTYDGKVQSLVLDNLPMNSQLSYVGNDKIDAGIYSVTVTAMHPNYNTKSLTATLTINKAKQKIHFEEIGTVDKGMNRVPLLVNATSGLKVIVIGDDKLVGTIEGDDLIIHRLGSIRLTASQDGDKNYEAADSVTIIVQVTNEIDGRTKLHQAFSPNGDGINDFMIIEGIRDFPENKLQILTRNGQVVFDMKGYDNDSKVFRGLANVSGAKVLAEGTYFYMLEFKDGEKWKIKKGWFVLKK